MKITVIGSGYVGLVTGACFAEMGNDVWCVDINEEKINNLKNGIIPIYEPGLEEMIKRNQIEGRLVFDTKIDKCLQESLFVFIAVGTPPGEDGSADLQHVIQVARNIGSKLEKYTIIITKSTVPVGTSQKIKEAIRQELIKREHNDLEFDIVSNPEFLKEGNAIEDFMKPDRVVIGVENGKAENLMRELYSSFLRKGERIIMMDIPSSELTKYAANAMLATKITFMNELSKLCEKTGADIENIRRGIGTDERIGTAFLFAGLGYGGSCFPKDVKALIQSYSDYGLQANILSAVDKINSDQRFLFIKKILKYFNYEMNNKTIGIWGLSFKPQTDDMREAPSIDIINTLRDKGALIKAHDPVAMESARAILGNDNIEYKDKSYDALIDVDALLLLTEWHQFRKPDFEKMKTLMKNHVIFDGRNQYEPDKMKEKGFIYFPVGRGFPVK